MESPEEEEEVKCIISTSSPHCLIVFKWTAPVELWLTFTRLKYVEFSICTCFSHPF